MIDSIDNIIPNIVLSSATLPREEDIRPTTMDFKYRFGGEVHTIISHDCNKSIPIVVPNFVTKSTEMYIKDLGFKNIQVLDFNVQYNLKGTNLNISIFFETKVTSFLL